MARDKTIKVLRTTRANLDAQKTANGLLAGEPYLITDENRLSIGTANNAYSDMALKKEAVAANILLNSNFEDGLTGWSSLKYGGTGDPLSLETTTIHTGANAIRITDLDSWGGIIYQQVSIVPGMRYKAAGWFYIPSTNTPTYIKMTVGTTVSNVLDRFKYVWYKIPMDVKDTWIYVSKEFVSVDSIIYVQVEISGNNPSTYFLVDDISLIKVPPTIRTVVKNEDEVVTNSATLQDDEELYFYLQAYEECTFDLVLYATASASGVGMNFSFSGPAGALITTGGIVGQVGGAYALTATSFTAFDQTTGNMPIPSPNIGTITLHGYVKNGAAAGKIQFRWAESLADGNSLTVKAKSFIRIISSN